MSEGELSGEELVADFKRWWRSKTILYNLISMIPPTVCILGDNAGLLQASLPPWLFLLYLVVIHAINIQLRRITEKPIK